MAKNFHSGTNILKNHLLGKEILDFVVAPMVKTHISVLAHKIPAL
jgi:hypothetical protein